MKYASASGRITEDALGFVYVVNEHGEYVTYGSLDEHECTQVLAATILNECDALYSPLEQIDGNLNECSSCKTVTLRGSSRMCKCVSRDAEHLLACLGIPE